jgi:small subunit ribosomal protein S8
MTDPIADMLTRIRNAFSVGKPEILLPMSKVKLNIAKLLEREGWIEKAEAVEDGIIGERGTRFSQLRIVLKYDSEGRPSLKAIKRISKPGLRIYAKKDELPRVLNNLGIAIISTPKGLMTNREARKQGLGGEVICELY